MPFQTVNARANAAGRLSSILLSDSVDQACVRLLEALQDLGFYGFCLGASDPAGTAGARQFTPVTWRGDMSFSETAIRRFGNFLDPARSTSWLLVPLGQSGARNWVLAVNRPAEDLADLDTVSLLELYGHALKAIVVPARVLPPVVEGTASPLSGIQHNYLRWAAEGKSSGDIAVIAGATRRTVDYHFAEILRKLGVSSRAQAIAWLAQAGTGPWPRDLPEHARAAG